MNTLQEWTDAACLELDLDAAEVDRDLVLDLARDVAHSVARPAAPLTAYLVGLAVGRGADGRDAVARITELALGWGSPSETASGTAAETATETATEGGAERE